MNTKKLFEYLETYCFEYWYEVVWAIEDYFREFIEKDENFFPSYWELLEYYNLAREYAHKKGYIFDDREH